MRTFTQSAGLISVVEADGDLSAGDWVCKSVWTQNVNKVTKVTVDALASAGGSLFGICLANVADLGQATIQSAGEVLRGITGLAASDPGPVRVNLATGRSERVDVVAVGDYEAGAVDNDGTLSIGVAIGAEGRQSDPVIARTLTTNATQAVAYTFPALPVGSAAALTARVLANDFATQDTVVFETECVARQIDTVLTISTPTSAAPMVLGPSLSGATTTIAVSGEGLAQVLVMGKSFQSIDWTIAAEVFPMTALGIGLGVAFRNAHPTPSSPMLRPSALGVWDPQLSTLTRQDVGGGSNPSGTFVAGVSDLSGKGADLSTVLGRRPSYGATSINGHPAFSFTGAQNLSVQYSATHAQPVTRVFVIQIHDLTQSTIFIDSGFTDTSLFRILSCMNIVGIQTLDGNAGSGQTVAHVLADEPFVIHEIFDGASSAVYVNGVLDTTADTGTKGVDGIVIGSAINLTTAFFTGLIGPIAEYAEHLDALTIAAQYSYLAGRYL